MASSLADGNKTVQPPTRNPHGFTLSGGNIPGDSFFLERKSMDVDCEKSLEDSLFGDSDDEPCIKPVRKSIMTKRPDEDKLFDAFKIEMIQTKEGVYAFFNKLVDSAVEFKSDGPHMAIDDVLPTFINGYKKIMKSEEKIGMKGHLTQYKILKHIFLNGGPLSGATDDPTLSGRFVTFFENLDRLSESMFEFVRDLSNGWNHQLLLHGSYKSNDYGVNKKRFPNAKFQDWMPTQQVFIARVLQDGGDVSALRNQEQRAASNDKRAYPVLGNIDHDTFI